MLIWRVQSLRLFNTFSFICNIWQLYIILFITFYPYIICNYNYLKAVEETYEQDLHQAILLSKLAYEEQLVSVAKNEKEQEQNKKLGKKSKKATMSLEEFNSMGTTATIAPLTNESADKSRGMCFCSIA